MRSQIMLFVCAALQAGCQSNKQVEDLANSGICYGIRVPVESYLPDSIARKSLCAAVARAIAAVVNPELDDASLRMQPGDSIERIIASTAPVEVEVVNTHASSVMEVLQVGIALDDGPVLEVRLDPESLQLLHIGKGDRGAIDPE